MARSMFALERLMAIPKSEKVSQAQQDHLVQTIEEQIQMVQKSMSTIEDNERQDKEIQRQRVLTGDDKKLSKSTMARFQKMRDFRKHMNRRSRVGALDFVSKLKNAIHFIKKGALNGDEKANAGFMASLKRAGQMLGQL